MPIEVITKPTDPYSPDWISYWAANPHLARGVGADAAAPEGDGQPHWAESVANPDLKGVLSGFESRDQFFEAAGIKIEQPDWRTDLPDDLKETATKYKTPGEFIKTIKAQPVDWTADLPDDLKETGKRFTSKADALRSIVALQKREGQVRVPGKDAKPEEIAAYHKAIGVPDKPEAYEFFVPEGAVVTDDMKANQVEWGKRFQAMGISKEAAKKLSQFVFEDGKRQQDALVSADKTFAEQQEAALRAEWKGDEYDRNKTLANKAFRDLAGKTGLNVEALTQIETKDGRFLMDRAEIVRMFAAIGREMAEGSLGPTLTDSEKDTVDEQIRGIRSQIQEAQTSGDSKRANKLYQQEMALVAKRDGSRSVVGAQGRMA